jgi:hypothetical protein
LARTLCPSFTNGVVYFYQGCVREGLNSAGFAASRISRDSRRVD